MKIFLDANVLVSVLCNEYPQITFCSRILSLCDDSRFEVYTSPLCLGIAFYFAEKKNGNRMARKKLNILSEKLMFTTVNEETVRRALSDKSVHDFEDGLQYYSALDCRCNCIVTNDTRDFFFSAIEVLNAHDFLVKHVVRNS